MNEIVDTDEKCGLCDTKKKAKCIVVNTWISGTCMNIGTRYEWIVYCPKCNREPQDRIEFAG